MLSMSKNSETAWSHDICPVKTFRRILSPQDCGKNAKVRCRLSAFAFCANQW
jgi:hypothetical protein